MSRFVINDWRATEEGLAAAYGKQLRRLMVINDEDASELLSEPGEGPADDPKI